MNCWRMSTIKITIHGMKNAVLRFDYFVKRIVSYTYIYKRGCTYEYIELVYYTKHDTLQNSLRHYKMQHHLFILLQQTFVHFRMRFKC